MKLSKRTLHILDNFRAFNQSILIRPGNVVETIATTKKVIVRATVDETFEQEVGIFDLNKFLGAVSLFKDPEVTFGPTQIRLYEDGRLLNYSYAAPETLVLPPAKGVKFPGPEAAPQIEFDLPEKALQGVMKATGVLAVPEIAIVGDQGSLDVKSSNMKDPTSSDYADTLGVTEHTFKMVFKREIFRLLPGDYKATLSLKKILRLVGPMAEYMIVAEDTSSVG